MKQRRHTPEQVIRKLREADRMLGEGRSIAEVCQAAWRSLSRRITAGSNSTAG